MRQTFKSFKDKKSFNSKSYNLLRNKQQSKFRIVSFL